MEAVMKERNQKPIEFERIFHQRNVDLGLYPECLEVTSHFKFKTGYAQLKRSGRCWLAHRYVWYLHTGEEPEVVMHLCDNPNCINIEHLRGGTFFENTMDMHNKGRGRRFFSEKQAVEIRERIFSGEKQEAVAKLFGVSHSTISSVAQGRTYFELGGPRTKIDKRKFQAPHIKAIRYLHAEGALIKDVAELFSVSAQAISDVVNNKSYYANQEWKK